MNAPQTRMEEMMQDNVSQEEKIFDMMSRYPNTVAKFGYWKMYCDLAKRIVLNKYEKDMQDAGDNYDASKCDSNRARINLNAESDKSPVTLFRRILGTFKR